MLLLTVDNLVFICVCRWCVRNWRSCGWNVRVDSLRDTKEI